MNQQTLLSTLLLGIATPLFFANADNQVSNHQDKRLFLKAEGGASIPMKLSNYEYAKAKPKNSALVGIGLGYNINNQLTVDGTFYHFFPYKISKKVEGYNVTQKIIINTTLLNVDYYIWDNKSLAPFLSFSGGLTQNEAQDFNSTRDRIKVQGKTSTQYAWSLGGGLKIKASNAINFKFSYKHLDLGKIETSNYGTIVDNGVMAAGSFPSVKSRFKIHAIMGGLEYNF